MDISKNNWLNSNLKMPNNRDSTRREMIRQVLMGIVAQYGVPERIRVDNGPEFIAFGKLRMGRKTKDRVSALLIRPLPHRGALVALQQSLILRVGKKNIP